MLNHRQVKESFEALSDLELELFPDYSSSSHPVKDSDTPEYWQIFLEKNLVGVLYDNNPIIGLFARVYKYHPEILPISQEKIDLVYHILSKITRGNTIYMSLS